MQQGGLYGHHHQGRRRLGWWSHVSRKGVALRVRRRTARLSCYTRQSCLMSLNLPEYPDWGGCARDVTFRGDCEVYPDVVTIARSKHLKFAIPVDSYGGISFMMSRGDLRAG